jgi:hypothetical protein
LAAQNLRPNYVSTSVLYPVLDKFRGTELPDFYAKLRHHHDFESFEQGGDEGAVLETDGLRRLDLERGSMQLEEWPRTSFDVVQKNIVDIVETANSHFGLYSVQVSHARIRASLDLPHDGPAVLDVLKGDVIELADDQYAHLGAIERASVRFAGHRADPDVGWSIEIGPSFEDEHQVDLRLETHPHYRTDRSEAVGDFLSLSYEFLDDKIVQFVNTFLN